MGQKLSQCDHGNHIRASRSVASTAIGTSATGIKEAKKQFDARKLNEYCVALANEGSGMLVLGVADLDAQQVVELLDTQTFFESPKATVSDRSDRCHGATDTREDGGQIRGHFHHPPPRRVGIGTSVRRRIEISNPGEPLVPVERFIDGYQSRNENLADLMRRAGICEEKSSGVDRVVQAAEGYQLPAPDFRSGFRRTSAIIYGPKRFDEMDRSDRVRACYQHCALKWVALQPMTNQSLRARFHLGEDKAAIASQIIAATIDAKLIKPDQSVRGSRKFARYQPFWA